MIYINRPAGPTLLVVSSYTEGNGVLSIVGMSGPLPPSLRSKTGDTQTGWPTCLAPLGGQQGVTESSIVTATTHPSRWCLSV